MRNIAEDRMTPEEVAKILGIGAPTVKNALIAGVFPVGFAVPTVDEFGEETGAYRFIIIRRRFEAYYNAEDLRPAVLMSPSDMANFKKEAT